MTLARAEKAFIWTLCSRHDAAHVNEDKRRTGTACLECGGRREWMFCSDWGGGTLRYNKSIYPYLSWQENKYLYQQLLKMSWSKKDKWPQNISSERFYYKSNYCRSIISPSEDGLVEKEKTNSNIHSVPRGLPQTARVSKAHFGLEGAKLLPAESG